METTPPPDDSMDKGAGKPSAARTAAVMLLVVAILSFLSWAVEKLLSPGISAAGYGAAIIISSAMVFFTLMALRKTGISD